LSFREFIFSTLEKNFSKINIPIKYALCSEKNHPLFSLITVRNVSAWLYVISGVPHWSILGTLLFLIFTNDTDKVIVNKLLKFADDTKLVGTVSSEYEINQLPSDLTQLYDWSVDWQM